MKQKHSQLVVDLCRTEKSPDHLGNTEIVQKCEPLEEEEEEVPPESAQNSRNCSVDGFTPVLWFIWSRTSEEIRHCWISGLVSLVFTLVFCSL